MTSTREIATSLRAVLAKAGIAPGMALPSEGVPGYDPESLRVALTDLAKFTAAALEKVTGGTVPGTFGSELRDLAAVLAKLADNVDGRDASATVKVDLTKSQLLAWADVQTRAASLEDPEPARKRLAHLAAVLAVAKALNFEESGAAPRPLPFTMETAYAPFGGKDGSVMGLTANADQKVTEPGLGIGGGGGGGGANFASTTLTPPAYAAGGGAAGIQGTSQPGPGQSNFDQGGGVSPLGKSAGASWPLDLAARAGSRFEDDAPPAGGSDAGWGKDPSGLRG